MPLPTDPLFGSALPLIPSEGWSSPPECPTQSQDTFCATCYGWESGPASLDRDEDGDRFGESMAIADFNGDGYPDLAVGAPGEDVGGNADAGAVYVYLGTVRGFEPWRVLYYEGVVRNRTRGDAVRHAARGG
ncbi:MAG: integrin alpha [Sandaracinaceae bacterium]|nr:integrin alpha [Sandaracinaceae bacterium]